MGQIRQVKIYGERNTGTNYLSELIKANFQVKLIPGKAPLHIQLKERLTSGNESTRDTYFRETFDTNLGWKHAKVDVVKLKDVSKFEQVGFLCLVKNPYSWLASLYRSPHHFEGIELGKFEDFLSRKDLKVLKRDQLTVGYSSPVELWNQKNRSYHTLAKEPNTFLIRYEDLAQAPHEIVEQIAARFELDMKNDRVINIQKSTKSGNKRSYEDYRAYYESEAWKEKFAPESIQIVNNQLDAELVLNLGYSLL